MLIRTLGAQATTDMNWAQTIATHQEYFDNYLEHVVHLGALVFHVWLTYGSNLVRIWIISGSPMVYRGFVLAHIWFTFGVSLCCP